MRNEIDFFFGVMRVTMQRYGRLECSRLVRLRVKTSQTCIHLTPLNPLDTDQKSSLVNNTNRGMLRVRQDKVTTIEILESLLLFGSSEFKFFDRFWPIFF